MSKSVSFNQQKHLISFDPSSAFALVETMVERSDVKLPNKAIREVMVYLITNLDMNLAFTSTYWEPIALEKYAQSSGSLPSLSNLSKKQMNLVMTILKPLGLEFFSIAYRNGIFKPNHSDTFPYIVRSLDNAMVVLEEDNCQPGFSL